MKKSYRHILTAVVISCLISVGLSYRILSPSTDARIADYYTTENLVNLSPYLLKNKIQSGEPITIVDVRDPAAYKASHIQGAVNIPANDPDLLSKFEALPKDVPIVTYCYTFDCMASRQVGLMLSEHGMYVQHLDVGYAERAQEEWTGDITVTGGKNTGACPLTGGAGC